MSSKFEKEKQKHLQERCQRFLTEMLKDDDNKYCVDCDAKGPRWASWNIGIFLCIRCAGIHRNLGVHISRVKSVNLDSWTPQQIVCLQQMGNSRARAVYEANLPDSFRRPQSDSSLEAFIRAKYEHKKYIAREWVQPPLPKVNWDREIEEELERMKKRKREVKSVASRPLSTPSILQPLSKPATIPSPTLSTKSSQNTTDLLGLDTPTKEVPSKKTVSEPDLFACFNGTENSLPSSAKGDVLVSINPTEPVGNTVAAKRSEEEENFFSQSSVTSSSPAVSKQKQLTKDSILALYGNTPSFSMPVSGMVPPSYPFSASNGFPQPVSQVYQNGVENAIFQNGTSSPVGNNAYYSSGGSQQMYQGFQAQKLNQQLAALNLNMSTLPSQNQVKQQDAFSAMPSSQQNMFNQPLNHQWQ